MESTEESHQNHKRLDDNKKINLKVGHLDVAEAFVFAGEFVSDQDDVLDGTDLTKEFAKISFNNFHG